MLALTCTRHGRPRPRSSLWTYVFATKSFRVRSVLLVSRARIGAGVITHATIPLTSSCCSLASERALPPKFLVWELSSLHLALVPDGQSAPFACTDRLVSEPCRTISSVWHPFMPAAVTRLRHASPVFQRGPFTTLLSVRPCVKASLVSSCPLVVVVTALLVIPSLCLSCIRALIPSWTCGSPRQNAPSRKNRQVRITNASCRLPAAELLRENSFDHVARLLRARCGTPLD